MSEARGARIVGLSLGGLWLAALLLAAIATNAEQQTATAEVAQLDRETTTRAEPADDQIPGSQTFTRGTNLLSPH